MEKKTKDFLVDTALGEKSYTVPQIEEEKIVLKIEEGAVPVSLLHEAGRGAKSLPDKFFLARLKEIIQSAGNPQAKDKATFFRLLSIMINAGVPLIKSLDTIAEQTVNKRLRDALFDIARDIEKGGVMSASMARYPRIFSESQTGMIRSGEASGQLQNILKQLALEVEKSAAIKRKVRGAMMYPAFIIFVMISVLSGMMIFVVPKIAAVFTESGKKLPVLTTIVIKISDFMSNHWGWIFGMLAGLIIAFVAVRRTRQGKYTTDWLLLHLPLIGSLVQKAILARFSRSLGSLLNSGVPIIQGLQINARGLGNEIYRKRVELAVEDLSRGIPLGESLRDTPEFPGMMVQMIAIGEQTAQLDNVAVKVAEYYEDEVDTLIAGLSKVLEPLILVIVGLAVGIIVAAIMLPIVQLAQIGGSM